MLAYRSVRAKTVLFRLSAKEEKTILWTLSFGMCIFAANLRASVVASILLRCLLWVAIISDSCPAGILFLSIAPICSLLGGIEYWTRHLRYFPFFVVALLQEEPCHRRFWLLIG